jgi:glutamate-ammonia-ligase adenylyltransferase
MSHDNKNVIACPPKTHHERLLEALGEEYLRSFPREQQVRHLREMELLSKEEPVRVILDALSEGLFSCTVIAFDYPWEFSLITGLLSGFGFDILSGDVFTSGPIGQVGREDDRHYVSRKRIIDHFTGTIIKPMPPEEWQKEFAFSLRHIVSLLELGDSASLEKARAYVNSKVVSRIGELPDVPVFYPVNIEIDNSSPRCTAMTVTSQDTPAFLYSLSTALSIRGLLIERVRIRTVHGCVEDRIEILDGKGNKITDQNELDRLVLSVLFTKQFTYCLANAPDPYTALVRFAGMMEDLLLSPGRQMWIELLRDPTRLNDLARILGASDYLWEDFIRVQYEALLPVLSRHMEERASPTPPDQLRRIAEAIVKGEGDLEEKAKALNKLKDRELFLIDLDQILNPDTSFERFSRRLTELAEIIVSATLSACLENLYKRFGRPRTVGGLESAVAVFGLGKFGGKALGYASDIELLFVYSDNGRTDGVQSIENSEFYERLVRSFIGAVRTKRQGIFRVDMRLRPYGESGPLAVSLESYCRYFGAEGGAQDYERLAQVRLRAVAGDPVLGARVERLRDELIYSGARIRWDKIWALREKQYLAKALGDRPNAKFCAGGLVDVEYGIQAIQAEFGKAHVTLRSPVLEDALEAMGQEGTLHHEEAETLRKSYRFLRALINGMRMLRGSAEDLFLPESHSPESDHLARRIGYRQAAGLTPGEQLRIDFEAHTAAVRAFIERHFGKESVPSPRPFTIADVVLSEDPPEDKYLEVLSKAGFRDLKRAYGNLIAIAGKGSRRMTFAKLLVLAADILRTSPDPDMALNNLERYIRVLPSAEFHYGIMLSQPMRLEILLGVFSFSQFLSDTLVRNPTFLDWVVMPEIARWPRKKDQLTAELLGSFDKYEDQKGWLNELRRIRRREILRIGIRDLCFGVPIPEITEELSIVAESFLDVALRTRLDQEKASLGSAIQLIGIEDPGDLFCILAFGKLGGRELNYSSDIDIVAFYDDRALKGYDPAKAHFGIEGEAKPFFSRVMAGVINSLGSHTEEGYAYRIDMRLRPFGISGELVTGFGAVMAYYKNNASLWELQALIKARPVAGNIALGEELLEALRGRLISLAGFPSAGREIDAMRRRGIEFRRSKVANGRDVKNSPGGIRDVEFLVQGLQMMNAKSLPFPLDGNTLRALKLLSEHSLLPEDEAHQLRDDYILLRRIEHFLQIMDDRQIHSLPSSEEELIPLSRKLLGRGAKPEDLLALLDKVFLRTREVYSRRLLLDD